MKQYAFETQHRWLEIQHSKQDVPFEKRTQPFYHDWQHQEEETFRVVEHREGEGESTRLVLGVAGEGLGRFFSYIRTNAHYLEYTGLVETIDFGDKLFHFQDLHLNNVVVKNVNIKSTFFDNMQAEEVLFNNIHFSYCGFLDACFVDCVFEDCIFDVCSFMDTLFRKHNFTVEFRNCTFTNSFFKDADLADLKIKDCHFLKNDLFEAHLAHNTVPILAYPYKGKVLLKSNDVCLEPDAFFAYYDKVSPLNFPKEGLASWQLENNKKLLNEIKATVPFAKRIAQVRGWID